jgi:hypothetical protein
MEIDKAHLCIVDRLKAFLGLTGKHDFCVVVISHMLAFLNCNLLQKSRKIGKRAGIQVISTSD